MLIITINSLAVLALTGTALVAFDKQRIEATIQQELSVLGQLIGDSSTAALTFGDNRVATENLASLGARTSIEVACIFEESNKLFAEYPTGPAGGSGCPPLFEVEGQAERGDYMFVTQPILLDGSQIGTIYLQANLMDIGVRLRQYLTGVGIILTLSILLSVALSSKLQEFISQPLTNLAKCAKSVAENGDYSLRAKKESEDEIGFLVESFNGMLVTIESQNRELLLTNENLEGVVAERTRELEVKNRSLMEASRLKTEFLSSMTHELRTPLNSIIGFTRQVLKKTEGVIPEKQQKNLQRVDRCSHTLLNLINDLLDFSRLQAGEMDVVPESFSLNQLISEVKSDLDSSKLSGGGTITVLPSSEEITLFSDREKLKKILNNLIGNAIKFSSATSEASVTISAAINDGEGTSQALKKGGRYAFFSVTDRGIGIAEEELKSIFDPFRQVDGSLSKSRGGTGMGLAVIKRIVELLGGGIEIESVLDSGTTVKVFCPMTYKKL